MEQSVFHLVTFRNGYTELVIGNTPEASKANAKSRKGYNKIKSVGKTKFNTLGDKIK